MSTNGFSAIGFGGIHLAGDRRGDPGASPVVFLHGGGQTRHSWGGTADAVADHGWQAITLDARGHGETDWAPDGYYPLTSFAADVRDLLAASPAKAVLVGASLGGLTSILLLGELAPGAARGLVLVDIIPDMEQAGSNRIQAFMQEHAKDGFASLDAVADAIAAYNPHRPRPTELSGLRKNLRERDGRYYWHWDPRFVGGQADLGPNEIADTERLNLDVQRILDDAIPVMLVRGKVSDLVSVEKAAAFCQRFPAVEFLDVSGAGHMVAGDRNDAFTSAVVDFLERAR